MEQSEVLAILAIIVSIGGTVLGIINHKRVRSKCCGREVSASLDIEPSTPNLPIKDIKPALAVAV